MWLISTNLMILFSQFHNSSNIIHIDTHSSIYLQQNMRNSHSVRNSQKMEIFSNQEEVQVLKTKTFAEFIAHRKYKSCRVISSSHRHWKSDKIGISVSSSSWGQY